jgi:O-antigen ligase
LLASACLLSLSLVFILASDSQIETLLALPAWDTLAKAGCLTAIVLAILTGPVARMPSAVIAYCSLNALAWLITWLRADVSVSGQQATFTTAWLVAPWLVMTVRLSESGRRLLLRCIGAVSFVSLAFAAALDLLGVLPLFWTEYTGVQRLGGLLSSAALASLSMFGLIACCVLWVADRSWLSPLLIVGHLAVIYASGSRSAAIVAGLTLAATFIAGRPRGRAAGLPGYSILLGASVVAGYVLMTRAVSRSQLDSQMGLAGSGRERAWPFFWAKFLEEPLFGHGIGASYRLGATSSDPIIAKSFLAPHNFYLQVLVDTGALIGIPLIIALVLTLWTAVKRSDRAVRMVVAAAVLGIATYAFFDNLVTYVQSGLLLPLLLAAVMTRRDSDEASVRDRSVGAFAL